jgi:hypothetical protein
MLFGTLGRHDWVEKTEISTTMMIMLDPLRRKSLKGSDQNTSYVPIDGGVGFMLLEMCKSVWLR